MQNLLASVILAGALLVCLPTTHAGPLKVFILVGQSNMQGHAHVRTLEHLDMDPATAPTLHEILDPEGRPRIWNDVPISYLSSDGEKTGSLTVGFGANDEKIGPELSFGIHMRKRLGEPILIIKTAWGGKSLHTDFRPPSAGPYEFTEGQLENLRRQKKDIAAIRTAKLAATGHYYRLMLQHVRTVLADIGRVYPGYQSGQGHELAGFVWFQGWNDMVDRGVYPERERKGGYDNYSRLLTQFIRDVRRDLNAPDLPFVIGVMGAGGPVQDYPADQRRYAGIHQNFRNAMAAPARRPEFAGRVTAVLTEKYWDPELTRLREREARLRGELKKAQKEKKLGREASQKLFAKLQAAEFNAKELQTLDKGVSNAEFHYLGSAKILGGIGKGFAEAMVELLKD